jgi:hypothetical protein
VTTDRIRTFALLAVLAATGGQALATPRIVVSIEQATLRIEQEGRADQIFPVGVGRDLRSSPSAPTVMYTGSDPRDRSFYLPARHEPAFHRGLPYLRLDRRTGLAAGLPAHPFAIHGPVTPTLIWGTVSAGCVRMRPPDLARLYRFAIRHPGIKVSFVRGPDPRGVSTLLTARERDTPCPDTAIGLRRLRRIGFDRPQHDRICGGVDHWYAVELRGGEAVTVRLQHGGRLRAELYGMRAISTVAEGQYGFEHRVPHAHRFRGARYLRILASRPASAALPYTLSLTLGSR